jgi:Zn-finger nucleic acid-binding protein
MDCVNCGAPLPPKSARCRFCGTLNDIDLRALGRKTEKGPQTQRMCPRCETRMQTVDLGLGGRFLIERCDTCLGIFFDTGELESLLDGSVKHVYEIDFERLNTLIEQESEFVEHGRMYVKCPVCREMMNRRSYGARSGVVADTCKEHGVWLDGGELSKLLRWAKAGGRIHADNVRREERHREERQRKRRRREHQMDTERSPSGRFPLAPAPRSGGGWLVDFLVDLLR